MTSPTPPNTAHRPGGLRDAKDGLAVDSTTAEDSPCFGMGCPLRASCTSYLAVERMPGGTTRRVTCLIDGRYPGYLPEA